MDLFVLKLDQHALCFSISEKAYGNLALFFSVVQNEVFLGFTFWQILATFIFWKRRQTWSKRKADPLTFSRKKRIGGSPVLSGTFSILGKAFKINR